MKMAILGAGAMGSLFGGYLSRNNEVTLIDVNKDLIDEINKFGIKITEKEGQHVYNPSAVTDSSDLGEMDLIIVFVKAMYSESALRENKSLIGDRTYVMTLQNGAGHEDILGHFVPRDRIIIGSTQHNSSLISNGHINHGGGGITSISLLEGESSRLKSIADNFTKCGFDTVLSDEAVKQIWSKMILNASASVLTAVLQVRLGFILDDPYAWRLAEKLIEEAVSVANAKDLDFDENKVKENIKSILKGAYDGYTSIYEDLRKGNRTEVDTISGAVVKAGRKLGVPVLTHEAMVELVHAMEASKKEGQNRTEEL